jgi:tRNA uridine 5-carboxymethylaminomethyl modification enzyme
MGETAHFDVIVIGGGHAGCEASLAAARLGCRTLMIVLDLDAIALMPCNPSIGGPGKAQLVREIDALGGQMGISVDASYLQLRTLNKGKGPAVWSLRAQVDKVDYPEHMKSVLFREEKLKVKEAMVNDLIVNEGQIKGVVLSDGEIIPCGALVLATGVYLTSRIIIGERSFESGPIGQRAARGLGEALVKAGMKMRRFKTGTSPRIKPEGIRFEAMQRLEGDPQCPGFSFLSDTPAPDGRKREQIPCWLTYTTELTRRIILENIHRAPLFSGEIVGRGPRYCPSLEDKIVRFPERERHQVFLEPQDRQMSEMYLMGLSMSLPEDIQERVVHSIPGLENAVIARPGYAIEYDCLEAGEIGPHLEVRRLRNVFSAGQINGTSGYEEAAAQGLIAGINAARAVKRLGAVRVRRDQAYIGVMIDDLVTKGTDEPYRMLTARAEHRLLLRQDNADRRLTELGRSWGLVSDERYSKFREKTRLFGEISARLDETQAPGGASLKKLLKSPEVQIGDLEEYLPAISGWPPEVLEAIEVEVKYEGYIKKEEALVERMKRLEEKEIPQNIEFSSMVVLSNEAREKLERVRPVSVGQAARVPGVTPADIAALLTYLKARAKKPK